MNIMKKIGHFMMKALSVALEGLDKLVQLAKELADKAADALDEETPKP